MQVVGQEKLRQQLINNLPITTLIVGEVGSGRKTVSEYICNKLNIPYFLLSNKVEDLRQIEILDTDYVYILSDFDTCSVNAKNSMLKILEEDPYPTRFILTCSNLNDVPTTIQSRCQIFFMEPYSKEDLSILCENPNIVDICDTPQEIKDIEPIFNDLTQFCDKVIDNVDKTILSNALKIGQYIQMKKDKEGYNLKLFLKVILNKYMSLYENTKENVYLQRALITSSNIDKLKLPSVVKQMVFDDWVFSIRGEI